MSQTNAIDVEIYLPDNATMLGFEDVHYVSFVSSPGGQGEGTYGIPAIITDDRYKREGLPMHVLYVNPANIAAMLATRKD